MNGHVRFTLFGILITLIVSGSCNVTDPKKMIEIAAEHESPHSELTRLYTASVLPDVDESMAWVMAQDFAQRALQNNRAGLQADTADFPWAHEVEIEQESGAIENATGKPFRTYFIRGYFHVKNIFGARVRLKLIIRMRTNDHERWQTFQLLISDPSRPLLSSYIVEHELDRWDGFEILRGPDSLYTQLDAYLKEHGKQN